MATATKHEVIETTVVLKLTGEEAQALINGINHSADLVGRRTFNVEDEGHCRSIYGALRAAGFSVITRN